jgi:hypothetical protein
MYRPARLRKEKNLPVLFLPQEEPDHLLMDFYAKMKLELIDNWNEGVIMKKDICIKSILTGIGEQASDPRFFVC